MIGPTGSPKAGVPSVGDERDCPVTCALLLRRTMGGGSGGGGWGGGVKLNGLLAVGRFSLEVRRRARSRRTAGRRPEPKPPLLCAALMSH